MTAFPRLTAALHRARTPLLRLAGWALLACALLLPPAPALAVNDDAVLKRMDTVLEENARLRDEAWKARKNGKESARQAEDALNASDDRVERTRTEALAHVAGVSTAQVEGLRREGRSWGQAAGDLGVHPGFLGIGKTPIYEPRSARRKAPDDEAKGKRAPKTQEKAAKQPEPAKKGAKADKADKKGEAKKQAKPEKKDRNAKPEGKAAKPDKADKADKKDKNAKPDKKGKADKKGASQAKPEKKHKKSDV